MKCISLIIVVLLAGCTSRTESIPEKVHDSTASSIELTWDIPVEREDGSYLAMHEISAYTIKYSSDKDNLSSTLSVPEATVTSLVVKGILTYPMYFKINTVDSDGLHGRYSDVIRVEQNEVRMF